MELFTKLWNIQIDENIFKVVSFLKNDIHAQNIKVFFKKRKN